MGAVDFKAPAYRFLFVILTLDKGIARLIVLARHLRRIVLHVVDPARGLMNSTPGKPVHNFLIVHIEGDHFIDGHACVI